MHITKICVLKFQGGSSEKFSDTRFLGAVKTFFVPFGNLLPSGRVTVKNVFRFFDLFLTELQNCLKHSNSVFKPSNSFCKDSMQ